MSVHGPAASGLREGVPLAVDAAALRFCAVAGPSGSAGSASCLSFAVSLSNQLRHGYEHGVVPSASTCGSFGVKANLGLQGACVFDADCRPGEANPNCSASCRTRHAARVGGQASQSRQGVFNVGQCLVTRVSCRSTYGHYGSDAAAVVDDSSLYRLMLALTIRLHPLRRRLLANMQQQVRVPGYERTCVSAHVGLVLGGLFDQCRHTFRV